MRPSVIWTPAHFSSFAINYSLAPTFQPNRLTYISWYLMYWPLYTPLALPGGPSPFTDHLPFTHASDQELPSSLKAFPASFSLVQALPSEQHPSPHVYTSQSYFWSPFSSASPTRMQIRIICSTPFCFPGKKFLREFVLSLGVSIPVLPRKAYQKCQWLDVRHGEFSEWEYVPCSQTSILHGGGRQYHMMRKVCGEK